MNPIWLLRMAKWVRNPPSWARVKLVVGVVVACFVIFGIEYFWGWPEALTVQRVRP
ncbi:MAG: hypothetical protein ACK4VZ_13985 [Paracoccaceae bacterium]